MKPTLENVNYWIDRPIVRRTATLRRQKRPWVKPLAYTSLVNDAYRPLFTKLGTGSVLTNYVDSEPGYTKLWIRPLQSAQFAAKQRLIGQVSNNAALGITALEYRSSLEMIASSAIRLKDAWSALRRGDLGKVAKSLQVDRRDVKKKYNPRKSAASNWLQLQFGWLPLYGDIYQAVEVLTDPIPPAVITSSARAVEQMPVLWQWGTWNTIGFRGTIFAESRVRMKIVYSISNPNLFLLNRLGLLNPALVAWDAVPFSFVVDWIYPVSKVLKTLNWDVGITIHEKQTSTKRKVWVAAEAVRLNGFGVPNGSSPDFGKRSEFSRSLDIEAPTLPPFVPPSASLWKAITSMALLQQVFSKS